jgi:hypothetical protein
MTNTPLDRVGRKKSSAFATRSASSGGEPGWLLKRFFRLRGLLLALFPRFVPGARGERLAPTLHQTALPPSSRASRIEPRAWRRAVKVRAKSNEK